ncbi:hypothetical protein AB0M57_04445 [Streptomyces sp. NPDC051597]|uniref:hypothetical protein n=1 Tax=Streptomyces sp. NPDC051597 TaxID=3155049 RepID=UPI003444AEDC
MPEPMTGQQLDEYDDQFRDDVRGILEAEGWHETAENTVVAPNGALWTETNATRDSGVDAPDKAWSVAFNGDVPASAIAAVALVAAGMDLVAEIRRLRAEHARRVQCNDCGAVGEVFTGDDGLAYLDPSGQIWHGTAVRP